MPRIFLRARDPISSYSHFIGAGLSLVGLIVMAVHLALKPAPTPQLVISCLLFCLSLIALYCASGIYHFSMASEKVLLVLRKLDHAMIYVLIAGTYTPLLLNLLPKPGNVIFTTVMWGIAAAGIGMKLLWMNAPRWLGTTLYILMGWAIVVDLPALGQLPVFGIVLLVAGGLSYTAGGIIYMVKHPNFSDRFGFHEFFHLFVILGSLCHYFMVLLYIA
ncbi:MULTISPECIES: PAQR family membrane homeostasis protein TrhA [Anaerotruncus]|jgi:hemolysin III|uniref:PAQR family membrane homeostasis protein TrhA n=1 Tax=Anaerotruncus TaxID=244127 RepID=UPI000832F76E|nr:MULTISPECIES: hemolysin III family protein [Anaerotruncus]RGX55715.1 hemolysin III family protein [Anaerotruncus sp. AF02-27]